MRKFWRIAAVLIMLSAIFIMSGCEYIWPSSNNNKVVLPPIVDSSLFTYNTQPISLGEVKESRWLTANFTTNTTGTIDDSGASSQSTGPLYFVCSVTEDQYNLFKVGDKGTITLDNTIPNTPQYGKNIVYNGVVIKIPNKTTLNETSFIIQISGTYNTAYVKEGTLATFQITDSVKSNVLRVPEAAVRTYNSKYYVGLLKNGTMQDTMIKVGLKGNEFFEVLSGLTEGQLVIIN